MKNLGCALFLLVFLPSYGITVYKCWEAKTPQLECPDFYTSGNTEVYDDHRPLGIERKPHIYRYNKNDPFYAGFWPGVFIFGPATATAITLALWLLIWLFVLFANYQINKPNSQDRSGDDSTGFAPYKR